MANRRVDVFKQITMSLPENCWPWRGAVDTKGRPSFSIHGKKVIAYRLVYELAKGINLERHQYLLHSCDNPICCNPHHLRIGSQQENMQDMKDRERHGVPKTVQRAIYKLYTGPQQKTQQEIADLYGLSREAVRDIIKKMMEEDDGNEDDCKETPQS